MANVPTIRTKLTTAAEVIAQIGTTPLADMYVDELLFLHYYYRVTAVDATQRAVVEGLMMDKGYDILWDTTPGGAP